MVLVRIFQSPQYFSACVTRKKGRGGGEGEKHKRGEPPSLFPFLPIPYPF